MFVPLPNCQSELRKRKSAAPAQTMPTVCARIQNRLDGFSSREERILSSTSISSNRRKKTRGSAKRAAEASRSVTEADVEAVVQAARADGTKRSYSCMINRYLDIMKATDKDPYPLTIEKLLHFVVCLIRGNYTFESVSRYSRTVKLIARQERGEVLDKLSEERYRLALKGASKLCVQSGLEEQSRSPTFTREEVVSISSVSSPGSEIIVCGFILGICCLLRLGELLELTADNVEFENDLAAGRVFVKRGKTDQAGVGASIYFGCVCDGDRPNLSCPVHRLHTWMTNSGVKDSSSILFPISRADFIVGLEQVAAVTLGVPRVGMSYTGHSLRRSAAQILFHSGVSIEHIVEMGRWRSAKSLTAAYLRGGVYQRKRQTSFTKILMRDEAVPSFSGSSGEYGRSLDSHTS
ncbi:hypothetical protein FOL47_000718 [Perkinsus chesapeaki]|uniref:Tyr recombinase domain-containing protein n=1 Tax=Perkinsus chesapeaki TaxID=330153 RepID=A0A7J6MLB7_PERCH|nr:hypothetical protein FOL47_000718 [Perkinsus chesapeaki]